MKIKSIKCIKCGRPWTEVRHNARGMCAGCYSKWQRYQKHEQSLKVEAERREQPKHKQRQKKYHHEWYLKNRDDEITKAIENRCQNKERYQEYEAAYREANRETCRASSRRHWEANKEQEHERRRQWRQDNVEKVRMYNRNRRAALANLEGSFTEEEWLQCLEDHDWKCYMCGCELTLEKGADNLATVDHIIPVCDTENSSNWISNIGPLCSRCNSSKGGK